jgi:hypothetical protein
MLTRITDALIKTAAGQIHEHLAISVKDCPAYFTAKIRRPLEIHQGFAGWRLADALYQPVGFGCFGNARTAAHNCGSYKE